MRLDYAEADPDLIGVSRAGKTLTAYLALHYGIRAANYPLTDDGGFRTPAGEAAAVPAQVFGPTIDPERLQQIRQERRPNSRYSPL